jgi:hypothetical protein
MRRFCGGLASWLRLCCLVGQDFILLADFQSALLTRAPLAQFAATSESGAPFSTILA